MRLGGRPRGAGAWCGVLRSAVAVAAIVLGASVVAKASTERVPGASGIDLEVALGFANTFRLDHWTPLTVRIENHGPDLKGQLEVIVSRGDELAGDLYTLTHRRPLSLPKGSAKRNRFTVHLQRVARPLVVRFVAGGKVKVAKAVELRRRFTDRQMLVVLGREADLDYMNGEGLTVAYPHPSLLPDHWRGYHGVAGVVLQGTSLEALSQRQYEALEKWLAQGGIVVVSGGPDYAVLRTPRLSRLMPARAVGFRRFQEGTAIGEALKLPLSVVRPFAVNQVERIQGRVTHAAMVGGRAGSDGNAPSVPLILEREHGLGKVRFLTFDIARYPFDRWPAMRRLWPELLAPIPTIVLEKRKGTGIPSTFGPVHAALRAPKLRYPERLTVVAFVVLYLALATTLYVLSRGRRPWLRGTLIWAPAAAFAVVAYVGFGPILFPSPATTIVTSILRPFPDSPYAGVNFDLAAYTTRARWIPWRYQGGRPVLLPGPHSHGIRSTPDWVFLEGERGGIAPGSPGRYRVHRLRGEDIVRFEIDGAVNEAGRGFELEVTNHTGSRLDDAWVVVGVRAYRVGAIESAAIHRGTLAEEDSLLLRTGRSWWKLFGDDHELSSGDALKEALLEQALAAHFPPLPQSAYLIGFAASPLRSQRPQPAWAPIELALVVKVLALRRDGPEVGPDFIEPGDET